MMVGTTIASMIAIESIRIILLAAAIGPCGSRMFIGSRTPRLLHGARASLARSDASYNLRPCDMHVPNVAKSDDLVLIGTLTKTPHVRAIEATFRRGVCRHRVLRQNL